jgi:mannose-6-phosphate isomerase-like protein (cupin superfamily)
MQIVHKIDAQEFQNSKACYAYEYILEEKEINGAMVKLTGRYPDTGCVTNLKCKELAHVISGSGKVVVEGKEVLLSEGDLVLILPKEKYFWEGNMVLFVSSTPSWTIEQHRKIP